MVEQHARGAVNRTGAIRFGNEQQVWRASAAAAAAAHLSNLQLEGLRAWAASRMLEFRFAVFDLETGDMRPSFETALAHAAASFAQNQIPE